MYTDEGLQQWHYFTAPKSKEGVSIVSEDEEDDDGLLSQVKTINVIFGCNMYA